MRTLFIEFSYLSGNSGGVYASRTHINLFSRISEKFTLLYPWKQGMDPEKICFEKIDTLVPITDNRSKIRKFWDLCYGKVHRYRLEESFFDKNRFDIVVFDNSIVSSRLIKKFKKCGIKIITIHHNYQIEYLKGDTNKILLLPLLFWTYIYEKAAVKYSDLNITLTQQDVELLRNHYYKNATFDVLGVFEYQNNTLPEVESNDLNNHFLITGYLQSKQTEDSLVRWIKDYLPILKETIPNARLTVAGYNPSKKLSDIIIKSGISLIASPVDMNPILNSADYYICPTDCGGGLKLRIMDGLKAGLPVLTHKVSARGYEKMIQEGLIISYDNPESFKEGIMKFSSKKYRKKDVQDIYIANYNFDSGISKLKEILSFHKIRY